MKHLNVTIPDPQIVEITNGLRGQRGLPGDKGEQGEPGQSIRLLGAWQDNIAYVPLDAVTDRSSISPSLRSLYVHRSLSTGHPGSQPPLSGNAPVGVPPYEALTWWSEIGLIDLGGALGGIWQVTQPGHGFSRPGTPVTAQNGLYILAGADVPQDAAVAVVREVIDANRFTLQSTGFLQNVPQFLNVSNPTTWDINRTYYLSPVDGRVQETPPAGVVVQTIFTVINIQPSGLADVVVTLSNDLPVVPLPDPIPAPATTDQKLDNISGSFDGVQTVFDLSVGGSPLLFPTSAVSMTIYVDGNPQEPLVDYSVIDNGSGFAAISFIEPPEIYEQFWGIYTLALDVAPSTSAGPAFPPNVPPGTLHYLTSAPAGLYLFFDDGNSTQWVLTDSPGEAP